MFRINTPEEVDLLANDGASPAPETETTDIASFIENVNTVANATKLASNDSIEDAQIAAKEAKEWADKALVYSTASKESEELSYQWSSNPFNVPVDGLSPGSYRYSSMHWAIKSSQYSRDAVIDDTDPAHPSNKTTWSSSIIASMIATKSDINHKHDDLYIRKFIPNDAYNKSFLPFGGDAGVNNLYVARADHKHDVIYEPKRTVVGDVYDKFWGTGHDNVARGDHLHTGVYLPNRQLHDVFDKFFGTTPGTVSEGNHFHYARQIVVDETGFQTGSPISAGDVQNVLLNIDSVFDGMQTAEKTKLDVSMATQTITSITVPAMNVGAPVNVTMTKSNGWKNADYVYEGNAGQNILVGGHIKLDYAVATTRFIEGIYSARVMIDAEASTKYSIAIHVNDVLINTSYFSRSTASGGAGPLELSLTSFMNNLNNGDKLSLYVYNNTNSNDIKIASHTASWNGLPEGSIVGSSVTVHHQDVLNRDIANQHPFISIYDGAGNDLNEVVLTLAKKPTPFVAGNFASIDSNGNLVDSGHDASEYDKNMKLVDPIETDYLLKMDNAGQATSAGMPITALALLGGSVTQVFRVKDPIDDKDAVNKITMTNTLGSYPTTIDFEAHTNASNPHGITVASIGAASAVHSHTISQIVNLENALDNKYGIVSNQPTGFLPMFDDNTGNPILSDSGINVYGTLLLGENI